ncbi:MAG TPA: ABC transporter permease [Acidimicrobiales bacterium]|jgi:peptide/nickel transport system permease protein|nr:ABC transporter permease [Acidimicrobiales bacterium]
MPDDRELDDTRAGGGLLANRLPGTAATDELVVSRQSETLDSDDILVRKPLGLLFWLAMGWVSLVVILAVFANLLPLPNPNFQNYTAINASPSLHHLLGTDDLGRDLLSRLIFGARVSLIVGFGSVAIGMVVGGTLGLVSGYKGGRLDIGLNAGAFVLLAFPAIVAVIGIVAFWGSSLLKITIIIGVVTIPLLYRVVRASSLSFANRDFVVAARTLGATSSRIVFREILPNVVPVAITFGLITVAGVIVIEGSLAFLGLSVPLPTASWGNMISEGATNNNLSINPYIMLWPVLAMFLMLLSINLIGDRLRQRFDIREGLL